MKLTLLISFALLALVSSERVVKVSISIDDDDVSVSKKGEPVAELFASDDLESFDNFLTRFEIELEASDDYEARQQIFMENYRVIREHNERYYRGLESFEMGVNHFTHLTDEELKEYVSQIHPADAMNFSGRVVEMVFDDEDYREPPLSVNWRQRNVFPPVQNQGRCGSCYVFAAIATIEAQMAKTGKGHVKLSEQEAMDCSRGCRGGWSQDIFQYAHQHNGCASANSCPYRGTNMATCSAASQRPRVPGSKVQRMFITGTSEDAAVRALSSFGPVTAYFAVYRSFMSYRGGVYRKLDHEHQIIGHHAVVFSGFGDQGGQKYWEIRNSWGTHWGQGGYGNFLRGSDDCKIESLNHYGPVM